MLDVGIYYEIIVRHVYNLYVHGPEDLASEDIYFYVYIFSCFDFKTLSDSFCSDKPSIK